MRNRAMLFTHRPPGHGSPSKEITSNGSTACPYRWLETQEKWKGFPPFTYRQARPNALPSSLKHPISNILCHPSPAPLIVAKSASLPHSEQCFVVDFVAGWSIAALRLDSSIATKLREDWSFGISISSRNCSEHLLSMPGFSHCFCLYSLRFLVV